MPTAGVQAVGRAVPAMVSPGPCRLRLRYRGVARQSAVRFRLVLVGLFLVGLAIGLVMVARGQVSGDQLNLLARGWLLVDQGIVVPYGLPTSAGGKSPGSLSSLLTGVPLLLWRDYRAPALLVLLAHVGAWLVLDRLLAVTAGRTERLLFLVGFWLNPWQLYFAGHLWNSNWVVPFGALHTITAWRLRRRAAFWTSFGHVLAIGLVVQVHSSFVILVFATAVLLATRQMRLHWGGTLLAAALTAISLVPWLRAVAEDPALLPADEGFLGRGLLLVFPLLRGIAYLVRYPSLSFSDRMTAFDFTSTLGGGADAVLASPLWAVAFGIGLISLAVPLMAHRWLWPRVAREWRTRRLPAASGRAWLIRYGGAALVGALAAFALSPTTVMVWQGFIVLHVAVLVVVLHAALCLRARRRVLARLVVAVWLVISIVLAAAMAVAAPMYRRGGRAARAIALRADHPMLEGLGITPRCTVPIDPVSGWWPDALPPPVAAPPDRR